MNHCFRRVFSLLLCLCMLAAVVPTNVGAEESTELTGEEIAILTSGVSIGVEPILPMELPEAEEPLPAEVTEEAPAAEEEISAPEAVTEEPAEVPTEAEEEASAEPEEETAEPEESEEETAEPEESEEDAEEPEESEEAEEEESEETEEEPEEASEEDYTEIWALTPEESIEYVDDGTTTSSRLMRLMYQPMNRQPSANSSSLMAASLNANELKLYIAAKAMAAEVAEGKQTSTDVQIQADLPTQHFTAEDLGVSCIVTEGGTLNEDARQAMIARMDMDIRKVYWATLADCPYELFWESHSYARNYGLRYTNDEIWFSGTVLLRYGVTHEYSTTGVDSYSPDAAKIAKTSSSVKNAHEIVQKYSGHSNLEKLSGYVNEICRLNVYNSYAASNEYPYYYGDPWQLIYVFDNDPATNVVCEGYAKSLQYLCELSSFNGNVYVYSVSGDVIQASDRGPHMWTIAHMENGQNYLIDPTFCDAGDSSDNFRFLALPDGGSVESGYSFGVDKYLYDDKTLTVYSKEQLTLSSTVYGSGPVITEQPKNQTVQEPYDAEFWVTAAGSKLTYRWQYLAPGGSWTNCPTSFDGYNEDVLVVQATMARNGWMFRCVVSDSAGRSVNSASATLTVIAGLKITSQPTNKSAVEGTMAAFTVAASGTGLKYQWQQRSASGSWTTAPSTAATLELMTDLSMNGMQYRCVITDANGAQVISNVVTLSVFKTLAITQQPVSQTAVAGTTVSFTVAAEGANLFYQWQILDGTDWTSIPGGRSATLSTTASLSMNGTVYRCVVSDGLGSVAVSDSVTLTVSAPARITRQPKSQTVIAGNTATLTITATGTDLSYQWQQRMPDESWTDAGSTEASLQLTANMSMSGMEFRCIVTDSFGTTLTSDTAVLTVVSGLRITSQPRPQTVPAGSTATFAVAAAGTDLTYQWQQCKPGKDWTNAASTAATLRVTTELAMDGMQFRCIVSDSFGGTVTSNAAVLSVVSGLKILSQPANQTVTEGRTATFTVGAAGTGLSYEWQTRMPGESWTNVESTIPLLQLTAEMSMNGTEIRCVITDSFGSTAVSDTAVLTVTSALKITAQPGNATVLAGTEVTFSVAAEGIGLTYQWQQRAPGGSWTNAASTAASLTVTADTAMSGTEFRCIITDANGAQVTSDAATLGVDANIAIRKHPQSQSVADGTRATFSVTAEGTELTYQWQVNSGSGWTDIPAATADTLYFPAALSMNGYQYRCVITDSYSNTLNSTAATLTVAGPVQITRQPAPISALDGSEVTVTVAASGIGLQYQWQACIDGENWVSIPAANTDTLKLTVVMAMDGSQYRCVVTDRFGQTAISDAATLTITRALAITRQPSNVNALAGSIATFSVTAVGNGLSYQWQQRMPGNSWANCAAGNAASLNVTAQASMGGMEFRCVISDVNGAQVVTNTVTLRVDTSIAITAAPQNQDVLEGSNVTFSITAAGTGLRYQWQQRMPGSGWTDASSTTASLTLTAAAAMNGAEFRCVVSDSYGNVVTSSSATLHVYAAVKITRQPVSVVAVEGSLASFSVAAEGKGISYQWQVGNGSSWTNAASGNTDTLKLTTTAAMNGSRYRCVVTDSFGRTAVSETVTLTVTSALKITAQPQNQVVLSGSAVTFSVTAEGNGLTYQWQQRRPGGSWSNAASTAASLSITADAAMNGMEFRCIVSDANGVQVISASAVLSVDANIAITAQPQDQDVLENEAAVFTVSASGTGLNYQWQFKNAEENADWTNCSASTAGYNTAALKPVAIQSRNGYQYRCVITDSYKNKVVSNAATLNVFAPAKITRQPASVTASAGSTVTFTVAAEGKDLTYQWQYKSGSSWTNCTAAYEGWNTAALRVSADGKDGWQFRCIIADSFAKGDISEAATLTISKGLKITQQPVNATVLPNATATFTVAAEGTNLKYQWQYKNTVGGTWANCSAATTGYNTSTLNPVGTLVRNGYQYRCRISDGTTSVLTNEVTLIVDSGLRITRQPASVNVYPNTTASFTVAAAGSNVTYQWQYRNANGGGWATCSAATAGYNTPTVKPVAALLRSGYQYRCKITDSYGVYVLTEPATLNIINNLKFLRMPESNSFHAGTTASFSVSAYGSGVIYQWQYKSPSGASWANCSAATAGYNAFNIKPVAAMSRNGYQYRCRITDYYGVTIVSEPAVLTVYSTLKITQQPTSVTAAKGSVAAFSITAEGLDLNYQWEYRVSSTGKWATCSAVTPGYNTATLTPTATVGRNGYQYRCAITDKYGNKVISNPVELTVTTE